MAIGMADNITVVDNTTTTAFTFRVRMCTIFGVNEEDGAVASLGVEEK